MSESEVDVDPYRDDYPEPYPPADPPLTSWETYRRSAEKTLDTGERGFMICDQLIGTRESMLVSTHTIRDQDAFDRDPRF